MSHTSRGVLGFDHPDVPALRVTLNVMNATESYLWVCLLSYRVTYSHLTDVTLAIYSRLRVGLRGIYLGRLGGGFVKLLPLPSMFISRNTSLILTGLFNRARAILLLTNKLQKSYEGSLMDP